MYFFLKRILIKKALPSFLGALFYLLNLGTYQTFLVPFEMFTTLFATLPFIFWLFSEYLTSHKKRVLIFFSIVVILTSQAAYASTLWLVFFMSLLIFYIPIVILKRKKKGVIKRFFILIGVILALNIYWLLPNIYFALTQGTHIASANINKLFSEEAFLKNKAFGNIKDILLLKSFYFDWGIYNYKTLGFEQLTQVLTQYQRLPLISAIGYIFGTLSCIGLLYSFKKARTYIVSFVLLLSFCLLFLMNANQPISLLFSLFQNHIPLFKEALRFPDDKILNVFVFLIAILFAYSQDFFTNLISKVKGAFVLHSFQGIVISCLLVIYILPVFSGNFIHPFMRVRIPAEYFDVFKTLQKVDAGRVANFPVASPWGWVYHDWYGNLAPSFQGAGFLYFGMTQPILERDFDRWNPLNEQYYREISHSVYSKDIEEFKNVIKKYDISHLLIDTSVIGAGSDKKSLYLTELFTMFDQLKKEDFIIQKDSFGSFLTLYEVKNKRSVITTLPIAADVTAYTNPYFKDILYEKFGDYISDSNEKLNLNFPLNNFIDNEFKVGNENISTKDDTINLNLPKNTYTIDGTSYHQTSIPTSVIANIAQENGSNILTLNLYPSTPIFDNNSLLSPIKGSFEYPQAINPILLVNKQVFSIGSLRQDTPTVVGTSFLNTSSNQIAIFDPKQNALDYPISNVPFSFGYCDGENNSDLNILARPDSLVLTRPKQNSVCISIPLYFINTPKSSSSVLVDVRFSLNNLSRLTACLANSTNGICTDHLPLENTNGTTTIRFGVNKNELSNTTLILTIDKGNQVLSLANLHAKSFQSISESQLDSTFFSHQALPPFHAVTLPRETNMNYYVNATTQKTENDCKNPQNIATKVFVPSNNSYNYISKIGSFCDHFSFPSLPHSLSYLVYIKSHNIEGLPMTFCITNYTSRRCDIYSKLSKFKTPSEDVFLLAQSDVNGTGYDINIENIGIKGTPAKNAFYSATIVPIPFTFLSHIKSGTTSTTVFKGKITSKTFYNPLLITANVVDSPSLITLSYAYDKGFHAYAIDCDNGILCALSLLVRPFIGNELQHITVSSWKNGWVVPNSGTILITFVPQYLEYVGLFLVAIFMTIILSYPILNHVLKNHLDDYFEKKTVILRQKIKGLLS